MRRRSLQPPQRFDRMGFLAIDPRAFFELFMVPETRATQRIGNVDIIEVAGPLVQRDDSWCDSYEAIRARFAAAVEGDAQAIVLRFDSPGGDASGCFETARALREQALAANKPLYAYVDKACSAAYALASAATHGIAIGDTCCAGSIGVLSSRPDYTAANTAKGLRFAFVVSGARKLDGNPDYPITESELAETQRHVDSLAQKFFGLLEEMRSPLSAASVARLDGAVCYGEDAVSAGLADGVGTFESLLAIASERDAMGMLLKSEYDGARAALEKIAKGGDANAAAAKRALAALMESEPPKEEPEEDKPASEEPEEGEPKTEEPGEGEPKTEVPDEPPADKKKTEAPGTTPAASTPATPAQAAATPGEIRLAAELHKLRAEVMADRDARTRKALLAKRPDFAPEVLAVLKKAPLEMLREAVNTWPKASASKPRPVATVPATRGATQTDAPDRMGGPQATRLSSDADLLDRKMGLVPTRFGCRREGSSLLFGVVEDESAAEAV